MSTIAPLIAVVGPTGSGKSDLGLDLAESIGGEIVNCDSVQLYRYLNIGAAKVPASERRGIPHHLIDILDPDELFTAADYMRIGRPLLADISARGRVPIVVGGTGFYFRALLNGLFEGPARDKDLRARLACRTSESLYKLLRRFDPVAAERIHANDMKKLIRALEVRLLTRLPITSLYQHKRSALEGFRVLIIGLDPPREALVSRINHRCTEMFERGLVEEVRGILAMGFSRDSKALESIGYREAVLYLDGVLSYEQAIAQTQISTRQYAKRQRTWFRRESGVQWIRDFGNQLGTFESAKRLAESHIKNVKKIS